jgi:hypothetical protein
MPEREQDLFIGDENFLTDVALPGRIHFDGETAHNCFKYELPGDLDPSNVFLVPPNWNKYGFYSKIKPLWNLAKKAIRDCQYLYFIGYSLPKTDNLFRQLFALSLLDQKSKKEIKIFNPEEAYRKNPDNIIERYNSIIGQSLKRKTSYLCLDFHDASCYLLGEREDLGKVAEYSFYEDHWYNM